MKAKVYTNLGTWTLKPYRTLKGPLKGPLKGTLEGTPIWVHGPLGKELSTQRASLVCGPGLSVGEPKGS